MPFRKSPEETLPYMSLSCEKWFIREQDIRLVSKTAFTPWTPSVKPGFGDTDFDYVLYKTLSAELRREGSSRGTVKFPPRI